MYSFFWILARLINRKFQAAQKQLLALEMSEEKHAELQSLWKKKVELLTYPGKKVSGVHEAVVGDLTSRADPIFLYIDLVSRYLALDMW